MSNRVEPVRIAVLDDYQNVALSMADWSGLDKRAAITVFHDHMADPDAVVIPIISLGSSCCATLSGGRAIAPAQVVDAKQATLAPEAVENWRKRFPGQIPSDLVSAAEIKQS
jgi:hypothetical protein